jgi:hypothetical protein
VVFPGDHGGFGAQREAFRCQAPRGALEMRYMLLIYDNPDTRELFCPLEVRPIMNAGGADV